jgi:hypothetical protein
LEEAPSAGTQRGRQELTLLPQYQQPTEQHDEHGELTKTK